MGDRQRAERRRLNQRERAERRRRDQRDKRETRERGSQRTRMQARVFHDVVCARARKTRLLLRPTVKAAGAGAGAAARGGEQRTGSRLHTLSDITPTCSSSSSSSWKRTRTLRCYASRGNKKEEVNGGGLDATLEMAVPSEQRPVNELTALREGPLSGWAGLKVEKFVQRLGFIWLGGFIFSCPIAAGSYEPNKDTIEFLLSSGLGATLIQTAEVLARDRLLGTYEVKPIMARLKLIVYGSVGGLAACILTLALFDNITETYASQVPSARLTQNGILYNSFITDMSVLKESGDAAAAEARAQKGRPGYRGDEYYRALAGGSASVCKKFDNNKE